MASTRVDEGPRANRFPTNAYPHRPGCFNISNGIMILAVAFILRNIFFTDYRTEAVNRLQADGKTVDEIKHYVPLSLSERRQSVAEQQNDLKQMKVDIAMLRKEVQELRSGLVEQQNEGVGSGYTTNEQRNRGVWSTGGGDTTAVEAPAIRVAPTSIKTEEDLGSVGRETEVTRSHEKATYREVLPVAEPSRSKTKAATSSAVTKAAYVGVKAIDKTAFAPNKGNDYQSDSEKELVKEEWHRKQNNSKRASP